MPGVVGRDGELHEVSNVLAACRRSLIASAVVLEGPSGIGKTSVLEAALEKAASAGWLTVNASAHPMQATVPGAVSRRLTDALLRALGSDAARYTAGLDEALADESAAYLDESLFRLIEGVLVDYPLVLAVDDAQWADGQSTDALARLMQNFADRPLAFILSRRPSSDPLPFPALPIAIQPVRRDAAATIVRARYPEAPDEVAEAIVGHAGGNPIDLVGLATAARDANAQHSSQIESSSHAVVARQLDRMDRRKREFIQICSLIGDPIDYRLLSSLWPNQTELEENISAASGRYLVQDGSNLRFVHASIGESVRHTIPIEIPYRRRILDAMTTLSPLRMEDYERIISQADACGHKTLQRDYLVRLANEATSQASLAAAASAYQRALDIASPAKDELIDFYLGYAMALNAIDRMGESQLVIERALREASMHQLHSQVGRLAGLLVIALWQMQGPRAALTSYHAYRQRFESEADRLQLDSVGVMVAAQAMDGELLGQIKSRLLARGDGLPDEIGMRLWAGEAFYAARLGDYPAAMNALNSSDIHARNLASANRYIPEVARLMIDYSQLGNIAIRDRIARFVSDARRDKRDVTHFQVFDAFIALSRGEFQNAAQIADDALSRRIVDKHVWIFLSIHAAIAAWTEEECARKAEIEAEIEKLYSSFAASSLLHVAAWWTAAIAKRDGKRSAELVRQILPHLKEPLAADAHFMPISLSIAAARLGDFQLLARCATLDFLWPEQTQWYLAHAAFAKGYARNVLESGSGRTELESANAAFTRLGMSYYAEVAAHWLKMPSLAADRRANRRAPGPSAAPSKRELQIIEYVAGGKTNREIAEIAFLSERTVEAHLSNIFNKLGVSSRTQVATWYVTHANRTRDLVPGS